MHIRKHAAAIAGDIAFDMVALALGPSPVLAA